VECSLLVVGEAPDPLVGTGMMITPPRRPSPDTGDTLDGDQARGFRTVVGTGDAR